MTKSELDVRLASRHIGTLARTRKGARFRYDADIVQDHAGMPLLSAALPVKARAYSEGLTGAWFSGLLPEGERLAFLSRQIDCAPSDYMSILEKVGWECAGAVSIAPCGCQVPEPSPSQALSREDLMAMLESLPSFNQVGRGLPRVSLGGYQDKLCVVGRGLTMGEGRVQAGAFSLPSESELSTHILKPQPAGKYAHLIESEAWAMSAASRAARCAKVALLAVDGTRPVLCVERFDRKGEGVSLRRIHQEDCCQALGLPPEGKYASAKAPLGTDPSYRKIAGLLLDYAGNAASEVAQLMRQMTVNFALGNMDAHAKNYSFLYERECDPTLSPLYDVAPVFLVEPEARHLSLGINGKMLFAEVTAKDLVLEGASWGMAAHDATLMARQTLADLMHGIKKANELYPAVGAWCSPAITKRVKSLMAGL